jgi:hypothetical protein
MDLLLVVLAVVLPTAVAAVAGVVQLLARLRSRRPAHLLRNQGRAVTVAELLAETAEPAEPVRLPWPEANPDEACPVRPYIQDQFPTVILPPIRENER